MRDVLSGGRALERAFDHGPDERPTVGGAGMNVVLGIHRGGRGRIGLRDRRLVDGFPIENIFNRGQPQRPIADADDPDMGIARLAARVLVVEHRGCGHREIAAAAGEFLESPGQEGGFQR